MCFIFILFISFVDGVGWIVLLRFRPCLKELLFQEEAPNAVFLLVRPYFCRGDVGSCVHESKCNLRLLFRL